jgi:EAL domain-containing protein (putative c-di-GMP-specific phosphodiesterase class I)
MPEQTDGAEFIDEADGSCSAVFGPFMLKTALQPLFAQEAAHKLVIRGFEGLLRIFLNGRSIAPGRFFPRIRGAERLRLDAVSRSLHVANAARADLRNSLLFLNFDPGVYSRRLSCVDHTERLITECEAHEIAGVNVVCEIVESEAIDDRRLLFLVRLLRGQGFRIALDDYGANASDANRYALVKPDIIKFDAAWILQLLNSADGYSVLRETIGRLKDDGVTVVLEGLEQPWQVELALESGADLLQGFALARPEIVSGRLAELFGSIVV